jgi:hypothetical protein
VLYSARRGSCRPSGRFDRRLRLSARDERVERRRTLVEHESIVGTHAWRRKQQGKSEQYKNVEIAQPGGKTRHDNPLFTTSDAVE